MNLNSFFSKNRGLLFLLYLMLFTSTWTHLYAASNPTANFNVDNATPVIGQTVTFTDNSNDGSNALGGNDPINSWTWQFGANANPTGTTGEGPHQVFYTATGQKTVSLTVVTQGNRSDTETKTNYITVNPTPVPTAGNNGPACEGSTLSLTASNISSATYSWTGPNSFSSNQQNPTVSTSATTAMAGTYSVTATLYGYTGTAGTTVVTVNTLPAFTVTYTNITCFNAGDGTITITSASGGSGAGYMYRINGGTWQSSNTFTGLTPGTYTIEMKDSNECLQGSCSVVLPNP